VFAAGPVKATRCNHGAPSGVGIAVVDVTPRTCLSDEGGLTDPCPSITATASSVNRGATPKGPEFPIAHSDSKSTGPGWSNGGTISPSASEKGWVFGVLDDKTGRAMDRKTSGKALPDPHANQQPQVQVSLGGGRGGEKRTDQSERGNQLDGGGRGTRSGWFASTRVADHTS
jgi:hypothetical protein